MSNKTPNRASGGFKAVLRNASLSNLLQTENLARTTGVYSVISYDRNGFLHLSDGELIHAEFQDLIGESAALEILSWGEGQFNSVDKPLHPNKTIDCPLQLMLMQVTKPDTLTGRHPKLIMHEYKNDSEGSYSPENKINVLLDSDGNILQINGKASEDFAIKVALIDLYSGLIGKHLESGMPTSIEVCGSDNRTVVSRSKDGIITGKHQSFVEKESNHGHS